MSNLGRRVLTALILAPLFLAALFLLAPGHFALLLGLILLLAVWEWGTLCGLGRGGQLGWGAACLLLAAVIHQFGLLWWTVVAGTLFWLLAAAAVLAFPRGRGLWAQWPWRLFAGLCVLLPAWAGMVLLQGQAMGPWLVLWTMLMVWGSDIGGYFAGHAFGRHKLAPAVSPGKTVEGLIGGVLLAALLSAALAWAAGVAPSAVPVLVLVTLLVVAISIFGDLFESLMKRVAGVKDSGSLLPGHGGVLDRIDAALAAAPVAALLAHFAVPVLLP